MLMQLNLIITAQYNIFVRLIAIYKLEIVLWDHELFSS